MNQSAQKSSLRQIKAKNDLKNTLGKYITHERDKFQLLFRITNNSGHE